MLSQTLNPKPLELQRQSNRLSLWLALDLQRGKCPGAVDQLPCISASGGGGGGARMPSNLGIKRAPFLVLGNFTRNLGLGL